MSTVPFVGLTQNEIVATPEEPAQYYGGDAAMLQFIVQNIRYPQIALEMEIQGKCLVGFIVDENGVISDVKVLKGVEGCPECDREAVRVINLMPLWIPAKNKGKSVKSRNIVPINFKLIGGGRKSRRSKK